MFPECTRPAIIKAPMAQNLFKTTCSRSHLIFWPKKCASLRGKMRLSCLGFTEKALAIWNSQLWTKLCRAFRASYGKNLGETRSIGASDLEPNYSAPPNPCSRPLVAGRQYSLRTNTARRNRANINCANKCEVGDSFRQTEKKTLHPGKKRLLKRQVNNVLFWSVCAFCLQFTSSAPKSFQFNFFVVFMFLPSFYKVQRVWFNFGSSVLTNSQKGDPFDSRLRQ